MADAVTPRALDIAARRWFCMLPAATRLSLRGKAPAQAAAGTAFGAAFAETACRAVTLGERAALWLGPDEELLLAPQAESEPLTQALRSALAGYAHALVDISHRQVALELRGPQGAWLLGAACPLDLDPSVFPVGMCTRTVFAKAEIVLWRKAPEVFHVEVSRSFTHYVVALLDEIARELPGG